MNGHSKMNENAEQRGATVQFRDLRVVFGEFEAIRDFNLTIKAGEFVTILGPSGSGKTTALNALAGFIVPTSGDIRIGDASVAALAIEKRNVGMVFQNYSLFPHMTVFDNVAFPLKMRHAGAADIKRKVGEALDLVHLGDFGRRMPSQLSGGQRQRVAFARAIVFAPKVLLMDEPLGALDLKLREHMQLEIKRYQEQIGCTVLYVTHDQSEALTLSDRIVIMNKGEIVQAGTPQEIYDAPRSRFAAEFVGETNILKLERQPTKGWVASEIDAVLPDHTAVVGGGPFFLSIRPENIRLQTQLCDGVAFEATVEEIVFLGDVVRYIVRTSTDNTLTFKEHRHSSGTVISKGQQLRLGFNLRDAVIVPA